MYKRLSILTAIFALFLLLLLYQLIAASDDPRYKSLAARQSSRSEILYHTRAPILDRNLIPLTDDVSIQTAVIGNRTARYLCPKRNNHLAPHILGYLSASDGHGVTGIEAAYDAFLTADSRDALASVPVRGDGNPTPGKSLDLTIPPSPKTGVVLTLDADLQRVLSTLPIARGATVCMDANTAEILAISSYPTFDNPADALSDPNLPLYNRALAAYPPGSVIKPVIAAATLESGISPNTAENCTGSIRLGDTIYRCHAYAKGGHGVLNLYGAMANSCNPYFVSLTRDIPFDALIQTASRFGFGQSVSLASTLTASGGTLPTTRTVGEKANFSFGQGELTASPVTVCAAYAAIANGGTYHVPTLVHGCLDADGKSIVPVPKFLPQRTVSNETTSILQRALYETVNKNESSEAKSEEVELCGKTGTAQTGRFVNGEERLIGWFAGWFTVGGRTIAVTVMVEDASSGNADAAPLAKRIAEAACQIRQNVL